MLAKIVALIVHEVVAGSRRLDARPLVTAHEHVSVTRSIPTSPTKPTTNARSGSSGCPPEDL